MSQISGLSNWISAYNGQIDILRNELTAAKNQLDQIRYGLPALTLGELNKSRGTTALSGAPGRYLLNEIGRRIRRWAGMLLRRSPIR